MCNKSFNVTFIVALLTIEQVACQSTARCGNIDCVGEAFGCKRKGNETICNCAIGLKGDACELDVNECLAYRPPCGNRGYCINTVGTFICSCVRGWRGLTCASLTHSTPGDFDCLPGYTGRFCFDDIDECSSGATPCPGIHSNCVNTDGSYYCICDNGWEGTDCKDDIDECMHDTCSENEVCQNTPGSFSCICMTGWYGEHCDQNINECLTKPCGQFGNCIDTNGSFVCECSSGYIGDLCEINTEDVPMSSVTYAIVGGTSALQLISLISIIVLCLCMRYKLRSLKRGMNETSNRNTTCNRTNAVQPFY